MREDSLDALHCGQGRAKHVLTRHASEVGRPRNRVGQLGRLAAREVVFLQDCMRSKYITDSTGNQACCLLCCLFECLCRQRLTNAVATAVGCSNMYVRIVSLDSVSASVAPSGATCKYARIQLTMSCKEYHYYCYHHHHHHYHYQVEALDVHY